MPITTLEQMREAAKGMDAPKVAIAIAEDPGILSAIRRAQDENLARGILTGDAAKIEEIAEQHAISLEGFELLDIPDHQQAARKCCELIRQGDAAVIMKGQLYTSTLMSVLMNKQEGLNTGRFISHVAVFETDRYPKLLFVTDPAINIAPTLQDKAEIIRNAVRVAHAFDIETPLVACCCAVENVKDSMPATLDAARLTELNKAGKIENCIVDGPLAMDNALNPESARIKNIGGPVAGQADIILCTDIESANYFYKAIVFFAQARVAAMVVGAAAPIVLVSRGDSDETKYWSIVLGVLSSKI
jgi:phosphate butyryltransferase